MVDGGAEALPVVVVGGVLKDQLWLCLVHSCHPNLKGVHHILVFNKLLKEVFDVHVKPVHELVDEAAVLQDVGMESIVSAGSSVELAASITERVVNGRIR